MLCKRLLFKLKNIKLRSLINSISSLKSVKSASKSHIVQKNLSGDTMEACNEYKIEMFSLNGKTIMEHSNQILVSF